MMDLITEDNLCHGAIVMDADGNTSEILADYTVLACGGLGGLHKHSTNFRHITGDALAIALKHDIRLEHIDYVQIHPTTLYSKEPGRRFLISESVRGEGAVLLNKNKERFVNELLPRDLLTKEVRAQMEKDQMPFVWLSMAPIPKEDIISHFPNIYKRCLEEGYDCTRECIPVVPAQHYFMGGTLGQQKQPHFHGSFIRRRGNQLQRRPRKEPSGQQFPAGEPCFCRKSSR